MMYKLFQANNDDLTKLIDIIRQRIKWMDENSISQWNKTNYLDIFDLNYFNMMQQEGKLYLVKCDGKIVGSVVFLLNDDRWLDKSKSLYIHNLVSDLAYKGVGKFIIDSSCKFAKKNHLVSLRLDLDIHNKKLLEYYQSLGFEIKGKCQVGNYYGFLQEKKV